MRITLFKFNTLEKALEKASLPFGIFVIFFQNIWWDFFFFIFCFVVADFCVAYHKINYGKIDEITPPEENKTPDCHFQIKNLNFDYDTDYVYHLYLKKDGRLMLYADGHIYKDPNHSFIRRFVPDVFYDENEKKASKPSSDCILNNNAEWFSVSPYKYNLNQKG